MVTRLFDTHSQREANPLSLPPDIFPRRRRFTL